MAREVIEPAGSADEDELTEALDEPGLVGAEPPQATSWLWLIGKVAVGIAVLLLLPQFVSDNFYIYSLTIGALYLIAALGLNLTISGGIISIGTAAFLMIGGYTVALTQVHWALNPVLATLMAAAICGVVGFVTAFPALKLGPFAVAVVAFALGGAIAGVGGFAAGPITQASVNLGFTVTLQGFIAATIGGIPKIWGPLIGGVLLGLVVQFTTAYWDAAYVNIVSLFVLLGVLLVKPQGILGRAQRTL